MPTETPQITAYTTAQVATALGIKRQSVDWSLRDIPPVERRLVSGQEAAAWTVAALPAQLRRRLNAAAVQRQYRNVETLLGAPPIRWEPALQLSEICDRDLTQASKLRDALVTALSRQHSTETTSAEFEADGIKKYAEVFGHAITARH